MSSKLIFISFCHKLHLFKGNSFHIIFGYFNKSFIIKGYIIKVVTLTIPLYEISFVFHYTEKYGFAMCLTVILITIFCVILLHFTALDFRTITEMCLFVQKCFYTICIAVQFLNAFLTMSALCKAIIIIQLF